MAACLKFSAVGAPLLLGFRIVSPDPAAMRLRLAWIFAYSPGFFLGLLITILPYLPNMLRTFYPYECFVYDGP